MYNISRTIYRVQYIVYNISCTIYRVQYIVYNISRTIYRVQYIVYNISCTIYLAPDSRFLQTAQEDAHATSADDRACSLITEPAELSGVQRQEYKIWYKRFAHKAAEDFQVTCKSDKEGSTSVTGTNKLQISLYLT